MPELVVGQAGKELTHNQALAVLDQLAQAVVIDKDLATPPGSPVNGSMYIVAAGATGAWTGQSGKLAYWLTTVAAWAFIAPADGWSVWVADEAARYDRKAGSWVVSSGSIGVGIGQTWQDVTATRALATTYTNSTGSPISFTITIFTTSGASAASVTVNGVSHGFNQIPTAGCYLTMSAIVPNGATYTASNGGTSGTLFRWVELR